MLIFVLVIYKPIPAFQVKSIQGNRKEAEVPGCNPPIGNFMPDFFFHLNAIQTSW